MTTNTKPEDVRTRAGLQSKRQNALLLPAEMTAANEHNPEIDVGYHLRELRTTHGLSIRSLAERSGLNVNTLSLIENGKTSPSVSTLQQLANALAVPITAFFETNIPRNNLAYHKSGECPRATFAHGTLEDLGAGLPLQGQRPFLVTLEPGAGSGSDSIVHTGREFVYCLDGHLTYTIEDLVYALDPGDSLQFEAYLPHRWQNMGDMPSRSLLVMCPTDERDRPTERHFKPE